MNFVKIVKKQVFNVVTMMFKLTHKLIKTDEKTILFISHLGRGYNCNTKYIFEYIRQDDRFKDFNLVWALKDTSKNIEGAKVIKYRGLEYFYYLAKSKFWLVNCKLPEYCVKKENQIYIQMWHGTPLKRLAHDINVKKGTTFFRTKLTKEEMTKVYDIDSKRYDYFISPNRYSTEKFISSFKVSKDIMKEYGYPRNDYLVNITQEKINELKNKMNIPKDKKVLLYCPTWRDNQYNEKGYTFELKVDFNKWKEQLSDEWVVLFKPHYLISTKFSNEGLEGFLYTFKENIDINELYVVSDLMITDYSSTFFDYSILNRPIVFYMYDLNEYKEEIRGFYLDINKELPGPIIQKEDKLLGFIRNNEFENKQYADKVSDFRKVYAEFENGQASKKIVDNLIIPNIKAK